MHRILIVVAGFLIAISGLLFFQGGERDPRDFATLSPAESDVALTGVETLSATSQAPARTSGDLDLSGLSAAVSASGAPGPATSESPELAEMTSGVLSNLGGADQGRAPDTMEHATAAVLAGLSGTSAPVDPSGSQDLRGLIRQSMVAGQGDAYIDALVNEAVSSGTMIVPEALVTSDGRVDTRTLLASIIRDADGTEDTDFAALRAEANGTSVTRAPETTTVGGERFYVVEKGDSLAYIALLFFKDSSQYDRIYEANRDLLSSPAMIRIGQRLRIPG